MKKLLSIVFAGLFAVASTAAFAADEKKAEAKKDEAKPAATAKKDEAKPAAKKEEAKKDEGKKKEKKGGC
jgi:Ni/Co efflux regulator RcnB